MLGALKPIDLDKNEVIKRTRDIVDPLRHKYEKADPSITAEERVRFGMLESITVDPTYTHLEIYVLLDDYVTDACINELVKILVDRNADVSDPFKYDVVELFKKVVPRNVFCLMVLDSRIESSDPNYGLLYNELYDLLERNDGKDFTADAICTIISNILQNNDIMNITYFNNLINGNIINSIANKLKISVDLTMDEINKRLAYWLGLNNPPVPSNYILGLSYLTTVPKIETDENKAMCKIVSQHKQSRFFKSKMPVSVFELVNLDKSFDLDLIGPMATQIVNSKGDSAFDKALSSTDDFLTHDYAKTKTKKSKKVKIASKSSTSKIKPILKKATGGIDFSKIAKKTKIHGTSRGTRGVRFSPSTKTSDGTKKPTKKTKKSS
jgi:hypothetical protein